MRVVAGKVLTPVIEYIVVAQTIPQLNLQGNQSNRPGRPLHDDRGHLGAGDPRLDDDAAVPADHAFDDAGSRSSVGQDMNIDAGPALSRLDDNFGGFGEGAMKRLGAFGGRLLRCDQDAGNGTYARSPQCVCCPELIERHPAGAGTRSDERDVRRLEQCLELPILAEGAVDGRKDEIHALEPGNELFLGERAAVQRQLEVEIRRSIAVQEAPRNGVRAQAAIEVNDLFELYIRAHEVVSDGTCGVERDTSLLRGTAEQQRKRYHQSPTYLLASI